MTHVATAQLKKISIILAQKPTAPMLSAADFDEKRMNPAPNTPRHE